MLIINNGPDIDWCSIIALPLLLTINIHASKVFCVFLEKYLTVVVSRPHCSGVVMWLNNLWSLVTTIAAGRGDQPLLMCWPSATHVTHATNMYQPTPANSLIITNKIIIVSHTINTLLKVACHHINNVFIERLATTTFLIFQSGDKKPPANTFFMVSLKYWTSMFYSKHYQQQVLIFLQANMWYEYRNSKLIVVMTISN